MKLRSLLGAAVLAGVPLPGWPSPPPAAPAAPTQSTPISIVATTNVYGSIAKAVGGDRVTVDSLITDPAADPHSYESSPADAVKVGKAAVVVLNGGGYDDWMRKLVESADAGNRDVVDVAELSGLKPATGEFNEHVWYSLPTVQKLATRLATDLGRVDTANAATYVANAGAFNAKVDDLTARTKPIGQAPPGDRVAVTEPVPGYLIETAGLTNATPEAFSKAVEEDTDPPAAVVQETLALFGDRPVKALVLNTQTETPTTDQVKQAAQTANVPVVDVTETLPEDKPDYLSWMGGQIDSLAAAL